MKLDIIQDVNGNDYYSVIIDRFDDDKNYKNFMNVLLDFFLKIDNANIYNEKLLKRNHDIYHLTVLNVPEYNKVKNDNINLPVGKFTDIIFTGIGSISKDNKTTYFVTCVSKQLNDIRNLLNLKPKDFHITLGFTNKDLFHDRKNVPNIISY